MCAGPGNEPSAPSHPRVKMRRPQRRYWGSILTLPALHRRRDNVSKHESQPAETEIGRCHVCAQLITTQEDLLKHFFTHTFLQTRG
jgi:hypothetical protein